MVTVVAVVVVISSILLLLLLHSGEGSQCVYKCSKRSKRLFCRGFVTGQPFHEAGTERVPCSGFRGLPFFAVSHSLGLRLFKVQDPQSQCRRQGPTGLACQHHRPMSHTTTIWRPKELEKLCPDNAYYISILESTDKALFQSTKAPTSACSFKCFKALSSVAESQT